MYIQKVKLEKEIVKIAIQKHIKDLINKQENETRFTKFDSDNDVFLGECGEMAFAKFLKFNNGYEKNEDYYRVSSLKNNNSSIKEYLNFKNHFVNVNGTYYDKYDFIIDIFEDYNGNNTKPLTVDVKTQYRTPFGNPTDDWQFAINSNTVKQIQNDSNKVDYFLFAFSKNKVEDFLDKSKLKNKTVEELYSIAINIEQHANLKDIEIEIIGMIKPEQFLVLSEEFKENEIYRVNQNKQNNFNSFKSESSMYRIDLRYLKNMEKILPFKNLPKQFNIEKLKKYKSALPKAEKYVRLRFGNETETFPYDKVYLNSQYANFMEFSKKAFSNNSGVKYRR